MKDYFDPERGIIGILGRIGDLMLLNLCFLLCCIPVITIGASIRALCAVNIRFYEKTESYTVRSFFRAFLENLGKATRLWIPFLISFLVMAGDLLVIRTMTGFLGQYFRVILVVFALFWIILLHYVFFVHALHGEGVWRTIRDSAIAAILFFPRTLWMLCLFIGILFLFLFNRVTFYAGILIFTMIGFAFLNWIDTFLIYPALKKMDGHKD